MEGRDCSIQTTTSSDRPSTHTSIDTGCYVKEHTSKVKEISFIQQLTTEALQHTLTERLREVEARIQAGRARRLVHLQGIKVKQRQTREKAKQMSERRLGKDGSPSRPVSRAWRWGWGYFRWRRRIWSCCKRCCTRTRNGVGEMRGDDWSRERGFCFVGTVF